MITTSPATYGAFTSKVVLSDGAVAGEGSGPSVESAKFWAVYCAVRSIDPRFVTAGFGHVVFLTTADQSRIEAFRK